jgi:abortive infection bacteriophage resistance protein
MAKSALTIPEQITLLGQRGLAVPRPSDPDWNDRQGEYLTLMRLLVDNNYYRLSGYWRHLQADPRKGDNRFVGALTVSDIRIAYDFDNRLRSLVSDGLSLLEVTFRSRFAHYMAINTAATAYRSRQSYIHLESNGRQLRDSLIADIDAELDRSKERFVAHHRSNGTPVPVWAAIEVFSFGTVSKMYRLLDNHTVRTELSKSLGLADPTFTASVIRSFVVLRNICAHHGRLWNRIPTYQRLSSTS